MLYIPERPPRKRMSLEWRGAFAGVVSACIGSLTFSLVEVLRDPGSLWPFFLPLFLVGCLLAAGPALTGGCLLAHLLRGQAQAGRLALRRAVALSVGCGLLAAMPICFNGFLISGLSSYHMHIRVFISALFASKPFLTPGQATAFVERAIRASTITVAAAGLTGGYLTVLIARDAAGVRQVDAPSDSTDRTC